MKVEAQREAGWSVGRYCNVHGHETLHNCESAGATGVQSYSMLTTGCLLNRSLAISKKCEWLPTLHEIGWEHRTERP